MNCKVCGNTSSKNPTVSFFRFPKEKAKCREWAQRCDLLTLYEKHGNVRFYKSFRICSDHFQPKDIVFDGRKKKLLQYAMPEKKSEGEILKRKITENLCRLCAEEDRNLTDVYGLKGKVLNLELKLKCLPLMINKYDILPLRVCGQCVAKLNQFYDFILNCIKAESKLKMMLDELEKPKVEQNSPKLPDFMCFSGNVEDDYYDQMLQDNLLNEDDTFFKTNYAKTNHTNFMKPVHASKNVSLEHDYSRDQSKNQTETDQSIVEETKQPCDICLNVTNAQTNVKSDLFCTRFELHERTSQHFEGGHTSKICDKKSHEVAFEKHQQLNSCDFFTSIRSSRINSNSNEKANNQTTPSLVCDFNPKTSKSQKRKCQFCDRFFKNRQSCLAHEKTHTGETPYECKECAKGFRSRASLRQHRSVHSDKRIYNCEECGMSFKRKDTLGNHLRIHTGERPFVCKICGFAFKQRGDCIKHEKNHAKAKLETTTDFITHNGGGVRWNEDGDSLIPKPEETLEDIISIF